MYECPSCKKLINVLQIKKCEKGCGSFKCPTWFCFHTLYINNKGDIQKGHTPNCK